MPWFKVDDKFHSHPKVMELSTGAVGLWALAGAWCADYLTDGSVRRGQIRRLGGSESEAEELVSSGLWIATDEGYAFRDWHDYQPTREAVEAEREASRERQRKLREKRENKKGVTASSQRDTSVTPTGVQEEFLTPVPDPGSSREELSATKPPRKKPSIALPVSWTPTENHRERASKDGLDIGEQAQLFRNHADTHDRRAANWNAAFTTWLMKAKEFKPKAEPSSSYIWD